jgi:multiple sugar transport system permease protein
MPCVIWLAAMTIGPGLFNLVASLTPSNLTWPGSAWDFSEPFANYELMREDSLFLNSLWVQARLTFWSVLFQMLMGFGIALILNLNTPLYRRLRTVFLVPMVLPPIVVAVIWKLLYDQQTSPVYWVLSALGFNDLVSLTTNPEWALTAIIIGETWEWFPFTMLMILAGLSNIPEELFEAAKVDGATAWQQTWEVIIPNISNVLVVAAIFRMIDSFKAFPLIFVLTGGGPGDVTNTTNFYSYRQAFEYSFIGYSSAITVVLLSITTILSILALTLIKWKTADG